MTRLLLLVLQLFAVPAAALAGAGRFELAVLDVGQGDATVVIAPGGCAALFDGGPKGAGATIKDFLASRGVARLDYAFLSHFHADHVGGLDEVSQGAGAVVVDRVIDRGGTYASVAFNEYAATYGDRRTTAVAGQVYTLCGEVRLEVVAANANGVPTTDENARSVAVKVSFGEVDALIGGDLETDPGDVEERVAPLVGEVEIYKVHHHGSNTASAQALLQVLRPTNAIISVGMNNTYMHPHPETLVRLADVGARVWQTEDPAAGVKRGHVVAASVDGRRYELAQGSVTEAWAAKGVDVQPPSAPVLVATGVDSSHVGLAWDGAVDDVGVDRYRLEWSGDDKHWLPLATTDATGWTDSDLPVDTDFWYRVVAIDASGNESELSNEVHARTVDLEAPTEPLNLAARAVSPTSIELTWEASSDDVEVTGYTIERDGVLYATTGLAGFADVVGQGEAHSYRVSAHDASGNASAFTDTAWAQTSCELTIPQKSWGATTNYLYVKAVSTDPTATLVAAADGVVLGSMIRSEAYQSFSIRRKLGTKPVCLTVTSSCGGTAVSCF